MARSHRTDWVDQVIEAYKPGVDWTLNAASLRKTPEERLNMLWGMQHFVHEASLIRDRPAPLDFWQVLPLLASAEVEFIVIGGVAAALHGSAMLTNDLDIVYSRKKENLVKIVDVLRPFHPYPRGAPPGLPFQWDLGTLHNGLNFTLETTFGFIDLLGEVAGGGRYENLIEHANPVRAFSVEFKVVDLNTLIQLKRAAGRTKDFQAIAELEIIRDLKK